MLPTSWENLFRHRFQPQGLNKPLNKQEYTVVLVKGGTRRYTDNKNAGNNINNNIFLTPLWSIEESSNSTIILKEKEKYRRLTLKKVSEEI